CPFASSPRATARKAFLKRRHPVPRSKAHRRTCLVSPRDRRSPRCRRPWLFDLDLGDVLGFDDGPTLGLVLVALRDLIVGYYLVALFAAFVVADWAEIVAVQLVELNLLARFECVVNADGDGNQQKANVALPDRSHGELS